MISVISLNISLLPFLITVLSKYEQCCNISSAWSTWICVLEAVYFIMPHVCKCLACSCIENSAFLITQNSFMWIRNKNYTREMAITAFPSLTVQMIYELLMSAYLQGTHAYVSWNWVCTLKLYSTSAAQGASINQCLPECELWLLGDCGALSWGCWGIGLITNMLN